MTITQCSALSGKEDVRKITVHNEMRNEMLSFHIARCLMTNLSMPLVAVLSVTTTDIVFFTAVIIDDYNHWSITDSQTSLRDSVPLRLLNAKSVVTGVSTETNVSNDTAVGMTQYLEQNIASKNQVSHTKKRTLGL